MRSFELLDKVWPALPQLFLPAGIGERLVGGDKMEESANAFCRTKVQWAPGELLSTSVRKRVVLPSRRTGQTG